jgi:hypothetical protein
MRSARRSWITTMPSSTAQTWSGGLQYALGPATMAEVSYIGRWTLGADNATIRNVPEPGPGPIQTRRPIPELSRINAIRFDRKSIYHGLTMRLERRMASGFAVNTSYTLSHSKDDASSPGATDSSSSACINSRSSGTRAALPALLPVAGAPTRSSSPSPAPPSRSTSPSIAPTSALVRRSAPTS